ncbi:hypothetical protein GUI12_00085 [Anaplasmataceae bacterium AB001_6]|nr:hypothetical protein GUI12_00085 [Anaplasmataceae bacterium AB001_6]
MKFNLLFKVNPKAIFIKGVIYLLFFFFIICLLAYFIHSVDREKKNSYGMIIIPENVFEVIAINVLNPLIEKYIYRNVNIDSFYNYFIDSRFKRNFFGMQVLQTRKDGYIKCGDKVDIEYVIYAKNKYNEQSLHIVKNLDFIVGHSKYPLFNIALNGVGKGAIFSVSTTNFYNDLLLTDKFFMDHDIDSRNFDSINIDFRVLSIEENKLSFSSDRFIINDLAVNDSMALLCGDFVQELEYTIYDSQWNKSGNGIYRNFSTGNQSVPAIFSVGAVNMQKNVDRYITTDSEYIRYSLNKDKIDWLSNDIAEGMSFVKLRLKSFIDQSVYQKELID